jgi:hypothetical protein
MFCIDEREYFVKNIELVPRLLRKCLQGKEYNKCLFKPSERGIAVGQRGSVRMTTSPVLVVAKSPLLP